MATKRNDSKGYERGARGIDGTKGEGWDQDHRDKSAEAAMYGRCWWGVDVPTAKPTGGHSAKPTGGHSADQLLRGAKGKWKP